MRTRSFILLVILCSLTASALRSQWVETNWPNNCTLHCFTVTDSLVFTGGIGCGLSLSKDDGINWQTITIDTGIDDDYIYSLASIGEAVFAGLSGHVFMSIDQGKNWEDRSAGLQGGITETLVVLGTNLFAGISASAGQVFLSRDSGRTWYHADSNVAYTYVYSLAASGTRLFAGTDKGLFMTIDSAKTWVSAGNGITGHYIYSLTVSGANIFAGVNFHNDHSVFRSQDNGATWVPADSGLPKTDVHALTVSGTNVFAGTNDGGVYLSSNGGVTWHAELAGLTRSSVMAFAVTEKSLLAGTFAQGIWRRPLAELDVNEGTPAAPYPAITLLANYPNPFSSSTTISFSLAKREYSTITISDILGKTCADIFSGSLDAGEHSFEWNARTMPAGVYHYLVRTSGGNERHSLLVLEKH